jgi:hypothetical protein
MYILSCVESIIPMQLMMYIGNDLIESVPLDKDRVPVPGYLGNIKRQLKEKHSELITESAERPDFLVIDLQPAGKH